MAGLGGGLDGGVEAEAGGAAGVGLAVAVEDWGGAEGGVAGVAAVGREEEAVAARRRPDEGELGDAPGDGAVGEEAAGEEAGEKLDVEGGIERGLLGGVEYDLEGGEAVGLLLDGDVAAGFAVLGLVADAVVAGGLGLLAEADVEAADVVQRDGQAPFLVVGGFYDHLAGAGGEGEGAATPAADHAGDEDGFFGAVDGAFGEDVAEGAGGLAAVGDVAGRPAEPGVGGGLEAVAGIDRGAAEGFEDEGVVALGDDEAAELGLVAVAAGGQGGGHGPGAVGAGDALG